MTRRSLQRALHCGIASIERFIGRQYGLPNAHGVSVCRQLVVVVDDDNGDDGDRAYWRKALP